MKQLTLMFFGSATATIWGLPAIVVTARNARDLTAWTASAGPDGVAAVLAQASLGALGGWVALGLLAAAGAVLPGTVGSGARRVARYALPGTLYRLAVGAAGLGIVLTPVAAGAATTSPSPPPAPTLPAPTLPAPTLPATAPELPAPLLPTDTAGPQTAGPQTAGPHTPATVTVVPGDSLWRIAGSHLRGTPTDAAIAAAWPRWFAANRVVIGPDPSLIIPGQVLSAPRELP